MKPRLLEKFDQEILPSLAEKLGRKNRLSLPRLEKIVLSMGVGSAVSEKKASRYGNFCAHGNLGPKTSYPTGNQECGWISTPRRLTCWLHGHAAWRKDV